MAINEFFTWGAAGEKKTPAQVAREREIAETILMRAGNTSPIGHWTQGAARVVDALGGVLKERRAAAGEADIASRNKALVSPILAALAGGSTATPPSSIPMTSAAGEVAATAPSAGGPQAYRDAIASIESAGSGDYSAVGPTNPKLGRALGRYQIMEANIGPWSQEALGRVVTPDEFLANPQLQDAIFDKKFGSYVEQFGPEGAAQAWFAGPGGVGKVDRQDVLGTNVGEYGSRFINALGSGGGTPAAEAINAVAPMEAPVDIGAAPPIAGAQEQPMPVEVAGGGDRVPMAAPSINPAIIEALTDPQATPQTQMLARIVLEQQQRQAQAAEEQRLQAADPLRQLQIQKAQRDLQAPPGGDETFFGNPVPFRDEQGNIRYGQIGNRGSFRPIELGEGSTFAPATRSVNTGTEILTVGPGGEILDRVPVENEAAAAARARGTTLGQTTAEREMTAPAEVQSGENALALLDDIRKDPYLTRGTGASSILNRVPGTGGYDFSNKVEQAKSGAFLTAIQQMRGLGALSNAEGSAATAAITRMDTATSEEAFKAALDDYEKIVRQGIERAQGRIPQAQPQGGQKRLKFNPATGELE